MGKISERGGPHQIATVQQVAGALITVKAIYELQRVKGRYALVTMCIGDRVIGGYPLVSCPGNNWH